MKRIAFAFAALTLILAGLPQLAVHGVSAQSGSSYTNPTGEYTVTWDPADWFALSQNDPQGADLVLSNGISLVSFLISENFPSPPICVTAIDSTIDQIEGYSNVQPLNDAAGNPIRGIEPDRAFVAYTATVDLEGEQLDIAEYFECRTIVPFQSVLFVDHIVIPPDLYESEVPVFDKLMAGVTINGSSTNQQTTPTPEPSPTEEPGPRSNQPNPRRT